MSLKFASGTDFFDQLQNEMDQLFGGLFSHRVPSSRNAFLSVNLWEDDENVYVEAEIPGVPKDALRVEVLGDELTLAGERDSAPKEGDTPVRLERARGKFSRTIHLSSEIDADRVTAELKDGVLRLTLPRVAAAKPLRIEIR